jgi:dsDNA-specific endonuclease/ATPase MutS2
MERPSSQSHHGYPAWLSSPLVEGAAPPQAEAMAHSEDDAPVPDDDMPPTELPIDGVLDLHTFRPSEVADLVQDYLDECQRRGIHQIRIIHGKGKGTLRRTVQAALAKRDDVLHHALAPPERGGWGATLVTLEPRPV